MATHFILIYLFFVSVWENYAIPDQLTSRQSALRPPLLSTVNHTCSAARTRDRNRKQRGNRKVRQASVHALRWTIKVTPCNMGKLLKRFWWKIVDFEVSFSGHLWISLSKLKGYSGVSLINNTPWHWRRPPLERSSLQTVSLHSFSNLRNDRTITIHCSICLHQQTAIKKPQKC